MNFNLIDEQALLQQTVRQFEKPHPSRFREVPLLKERAKSAMILPMVGMTIQLCVD